MVRLNLKGDMALFFAYYVSYTIYNHALHCVTKTVALILTSNLLN